MTLRAPEIAPRRFRVDQSIELGCRVLGITPQAILRRAGVSAACLSTTHKGLTAAEYFAIWNAFELEYPAPDLAMRLGIAVARTRSIPAFFAFWCSPSIRLGLARLAVFKPSVAPIRLDLATRSDRLILTLRAQDPTLVVPAGMSYFEIVTLIELCRTFSTRHVVPLEVALPDTRMADRDYLGCAVRLAKHPSLTLSAKDADLRLVSEDPELWSTFEGTLRGRLARESPATTTQRLRDALLEAIPAGEASAQALATRLHLSTRSLQRQLQTEGTSFAKLLDATRKELAQHYLQKTELRYNEISYLLGYVGTGSFYRACRLWFGLTPTEIRRRRTAKIAKIGVKS